MEGWLLLGGGSVYIVKGDEEPLPRVYAVPRLLGGVKLHVDPRELCSYTECVEDPCLEGCLAPVVDPRRYRVVSPFEAAEGLSGGTRLEDAARELLSVFLREGFIAGVTGSLAYAPHLARDIDVVVYGLHEEAYELLRELRSSGLTSNPWEPWRLTEGLYRGVPYSIRLMRAASPRRCLRRRVAARGVCVEGVVVYSDAHATPSIYILDADGLEVVVATYRMRYSELPVGVRVRVCGVIEEHGGRTMLVPDREGVLEPLDIVYELGQVP